MLKIEFEFLLNRPLLETTEIIGNDFKKNSYLNNDFYVNNKPLNNRFLNLKYDYLVIMTDELNSVQSITINTNDSIKRDVYDDFIKIYGKPSSILVISKKNNVNKVINEDQNFKQSLSKGKVELIEGTFEENPLYIIWEKEKFKVKIFFRQENLTEIIYSL